MSHDVIIVGARCAGATLATYLARSGVKTLLLDAQAMPSDMPMSTHFVQPAGMAILDEIGVGDALRACTPPAPCLRLRVEGHDAYVKHPIDRAGCCPRRSTLDPLLQQAAIRAGAELRDRSRVVELLRDGERVAGVVVESASRGRETLRAGLVVGADGRHSTVARLTGVEEYLKFPMTRSAFWCYRSLPALWRSDPRYSSFQGHIDYQGTGIRAAFQCDGDTMVMVALVPATEAQSWTGDHMQNLLAYLGSNAVMAPLIEASEPLSKARALLRADFFYRRPVGPGFALVGDAGSFKDFATGQGISSAFIAAKALHGAILQGGAPAFERYWRERDVESLPLYFDALRLGEASVNDAFLQLLFENLARSPTLTARLSAIAHRTLSPLEAFSTGELLRMVVPAVLRGRFDVIQPFVKTGRRIAGFKREVAMRESLLRQVAS